MESYREKSEYYYLVLNEEEARYLRSLTQNYLGTPGEEPGREAKIRMDLFNSVEEAR